MSDASVQTEINYVNASSQTERGGRGRGRGRPPGPSTTGRGNGRGRSQYNFQQSTQQSLSENDASFNYQLGYYTSSLDDTNTIGTQTDLANAGSEYVDFLKKLYKTNDEDELVEKMRVKLGLQKEKLHPLLSYRQASYIRNFTKSKNPCDNFDFI